MKAGVKAETSACQNTLNTIGIYRPELGRVEKTLGENKGTVSGQVRLGLPNVRLDMGCLYAEVQVHNVTCRMLIDTGSPVSVLSYTEFVKLGLGEESLQIFETNLTTADGNQLEVKGCIPLVFKMGSKIFEQTFVVSRVEKLSGILGMDFLAGYQSSIQLEKEILVTNQGNVQLSRQSFNSDQIVLSVMKTEQPIVSNETILKTEAKSTCTEVAGHESIGLDNEIKSKLQAGSRTEDIETNKGDFKLVQKSNVSVSTNGQEKANLDSNGVTLVKAMVVMVAIGFIWFTVLGMMMSSPLYHPCPVDISALHKTVCSKLMIILDKEGYCQTALLVSSGKPRVWYPP